MPSYQEWVRKIDINIDYYSAFIKSWIAFNSWYRSEYTERTDRGIIEKLKTENNRFKGYIETMLDENNNSDEAIIFKKNLKDLQAALVNAAIVTQERDGINQQISFSEIVNNPVPVSLLSGNRKPQIRFLGNHPSGSGNLYHKSFRM